MATILIIDDVQSNRELVGKVVVREGHTPIYASDGDQAVASARQHRPSLIFLDVVMEKVNGFAACRDLKKDPETSQIPVVLVTSKNTDTDKFWGRRQGADDYITKPFTPETLKSVMARYVR